MLVGTSSKETTDLSRVVVDFLDWLDPGEAVAAFTTPIVSLIGAGIDTTPMTVSSSVLADAATKLIFLLAAGTPGLVYQVSFVATGSISGRKLTTEFRMKVQLPPA